MKAPQKEMAKRQNAEWKQLSRYLDVSWSYLLAKRMPLVAQMMRPTAQAQMALTR